MYKVYDIVLIKTFMKSKYLLSFLFSFLFFSFLSRFFIQSSFANTASKLIFAGAPAEYLYTINPDGSDLHTIGAGQSPQISPDGSKIVYMEMNLTVTPTCPGRQPLYPEDIYIMNADGSHIVNLTNGAHCKSRDPIWSPDGTKVAFTDTNNIWTVNTDGSDLTQVTDFLTGTGVGEYFSWTPDGSKFLYSTQDGIHEINTDGTNDVLLIPDGSGESNGSPVESPDGSMIAYEVSDLNTGESYLDTANNDGSNPTVLFTIGNQNGILDSGNSIGWSPDSSTLDFTVRQVDNTNTDTLDTIPASGGTPTVVYSNSNVAEASWGNLDTDFTQITTEAPPVTTILYDQNNIEQSNIEFYIPFTAPVTITLNATASPGYSVINTYYTLNGGPQQIYSGPFAVSNGGTNVITFWSEDNGGAIEPVNTQSFYIQPANNDSPPVTTATISPGPFRDGTYQDPTTVTLSATAASGYTVANTYYTIDGGSQQTYSSPFTVTGSGNHTITYWSVDNDGVTETTNTQTFTIVDPPSIGTISFTTNPVEINNATSATATFTDSDGGSSDTASWNWGDGNTTAGTVTESNGSGSVTDNHTYTTAGVYTVTLTVTNPTDNLSTTQTYEYVSAYEATPNGKFAAAKEFDSPAGAYTANPTLNGTANVAVAYKYTGGQNMFYLSVPGALTFNSSNISSLVISGATATLEGTGIITGISGTYNFAVVGVDNGDIRIQITDSSGNVIYDTQPGAALTAAPTTPITKGKGVQVSN